MGTDLHLSISQTPFINQLLTQSDLIYKYICVYQIYIEDVKWLHVLEWVQLYDIFNEGKHTEHILSHVPFMMTQP